MIKILPLKKKLLYQIGFWVALALLELFHLRNLYDGAELLAGGDSYNHLQLARVGMYPFAWDISTPFGSTNFTIPNLLGFQLYSQLLGFLGTATLQRLMLFSLYFFKYVAFVKLARHFYPKFSPLALFPAIVLVSFSAFASLHPFAIFPLMFGVYLPISLYYFIKIVDSKKINLVDIAKLVLVTIIFSPINANIALAITVFIPQVVYLLVVLPKITKSTVKNLTIYGLLFLLANLWWALPLLQYFQTAATLLDGGGWFKATATGNLFQNFRFIGQWGWYGGHFLQLYYPFNIYYDHPLIILVGFAVVVPSFFEAIGYGRPLIKDKYRIFLFLLLVISLFLISGGRPPFGFIYQFLFDHLPGLKIFREPFTKFSELYVLPISIFLYFFLVRLFSQFKGIKKLFVFGLVLVGVFLITKPSLLGEHVPSNWNGSSRSVRVDIPQYWLDLEVYANQNLEGKRVLVTPNAAYGGGWNWPKGFSSADDVAINFLHNDINVIRFPLPTGSHSDKASKELYKNFKSDKPITKFLGLMSIDYVLQENDVDWRYASANITPSQANEILERDLVKEKEFGLFNKEYLETIPNKDPDQKLRESIYPELLNKPALVLYKVPEHLTTPKIYSPANIHLVNLTRTSTYSDIIESDNFKVGDVFVDMNSALPDISVPSGVSYTKIDPTKYLISIKGITGPFLLQFTEQYHSNWTVRMIDTKKPLQHQRHLITNGFANGWIITTDASELKLEIVFTPQKSLVANLIILILVSSFCLLILLSSIRKYVKYEK